MDLFGDFDWTEQAPAPVEDTASTTPISKSIEETEESLIDSALRGSFSQPEATSPNLALTSKKTEPTRKAHDIFAELFAKHEREEKERRQQEEAARKKMLDDSGDESDDDLTSLLV